mgnify:CR=1 FL=1|tara:strand:+ start:155 stop:1030 length:876 start_codon:yes stop_codon:yes gene_type:complete
MFVFKDINKTSTVIQQNTVNYTQNLTTSSAGIESFKIVSGSINKNYWDSLNRLFYTSGSPVYGNELKFASPNGNFSIVRVAGKQHLTKYHGYPSSSIITIPSTYYGEKIKEGSFQFTDLNNPDNNGVNPIIVDDGIGNLYSTNAHHSQSVSAASSSDNYVGNIFYEQGLVVLTETGSWSGSVNYSDLATNFNLKFDSFNTIHTHEYTVTINPNEYNSSMNYTLRSPISGSLKRNTKFLSRDFTGSNFSPYITTINLYSEDDLINPVIQARLPKPIKKSKKITTTFKIKLDI